MRARRQSPRKNAAHATEYGDMHSFIFIFFSPLD
jgi:hypothetical protein